MQQGNDYLFYLTAYSNGSGEPLSLRYFSNTDGTELNTNQIINFVADGLNGVPSNPVVANVQDTLACMATMGIASVSNAKINCSVYPNPFADGVTLNFNKPVNVKIELTDLLGKVLYSVSITGKKEIDLTPEFNKLSLNNGMYYISLSGDLNKRIKIIRTK
jgi:hypothetical protein